MTLEHDTDAIWSEEVPLDKIKVATTVYLPGNLPNSEVAKVPRDKYGSRSAEDNRDVPGLEHITDGAMKKIGIRGYTGISLPHFFYYTITGEGGVAHIDDVESDKTACLPCDRGCDRRRTGGADNIRKRCPIGKPGESFVGHDYKHAHSYPGPNSKAMDT